jgi:hypothetical protein
MRDPHNHQSRGFGFITFQRDDSAKQVLQNRYHDMMGKRVSFPAHPPTHPQQKASRKKQKLASRYRAEKERELSPPGQPKRRLKSSLPFPVARLPLLSVDRPVAHRVMDTGSLEVALDRVVLVLDTVTGVATQTRKHTLATTTRGV